MIVAFDHEEGWRIKICLYHDIVEDKAAESRIGQEIVIDKEIDDNEGVNRAVREIEISNRTEEGRSRA
jgi:hypothetical protein